MLIAHHQQRMHQHSSGTPSCRLRRLACCIKSVDITQQKQGNSSLLNPRRVPWLSVIAVEGMMPFPDLAYPSSISIPFRCAQFVGSAARDGCAQIDRGMAVVK